MTNIQCYIDCFLIGSGLGRSEDRIPPGQWIFWTFISRELSLRSLKNGLEKRTSSLLADDSDFEKQLGRARRLKKRRALTFISLQPWISSDIG